MCESIRESRIPYLTIGLQNKPCDRPNLPTNTTTKSTFFEFELKKKNEKKRKKRQNKQGDFYCSTKGCEKALPLNQYGRHYH